MSASPTVLGLHLVGVSKAFGATQALADIDLAVQPGEVHTVLGENGSGKSTLVKLLSGVHAPDRGTITVDGARVALRSPRAAHRLGIATVFQEVLTVPAASIVDNVWLGADGVVRRSRSDADRRQQALAVLEELLGRSVEPTTAAGVLSLSDRQAICIARALVRDPRVLILDEATAALDVITRDRLFAIIRQRTARGVSVVFISHRMDEITELSDRVTVLRSGRTVAKPIERVDVAPRALLALMTGSAGGVHRAARATPGGPVLSVSGLRIAPDSVPIDLEVRAGELVGLAGLEGHGQDEFLKALAGLSGHTEVVRLTDGGPRAVTRATAARLGVAYLPKERRGESLFPDMSVRENFGMPTLRLDSVGPFLRFGSTAQRLRRYSDELHIRMRSDTDPISGLSGGNQQKVLMGRWLATAPTVLLLNDPTRGVDQNTKNDLYDLLERLCADGLAVVMLSSEMDELIDLMDRVLVFRERSVFREIPRAEADRDALVSAYFGQREAPAA